MAEGIRLLEASHASGIFFFGAKQYQTIQEDLQGLLDHAGTGARLCFVRPSIAQWTLWGMELANIAPLSEWHYKSAYDEDSVVDTSRAEQELEWRSERSNLQALQDAYDWYVASVGATGTARSTHPPPLAHRALIVLSRIY